MKLQTQKKEEIKRTRITKGALQLVRRSPSPALVSCQRYDAKCRNNYSIVFFSAAGRKGKKKKKKKAILSGTLARVLLAASRAADESDGGDNGGRALTLRQ